MKRGQTTWVATVQQGSGGRSQICLSNENVTAIRQSFVVTERVPPLRSPLWKDMLQEKHGRGRRERGGGGLERREERGEKREEREREEREEKREARR